MDRVEELLEEADRALEADDPGTALRACEEALALAPASADALTLKGMALVAMDDTGAAEVALREALGKDPSHVPATAALADLCCFGLDDYEGACRLCNRALRRRLEPASRADLLWIRGIALSQMGEYEEALRSLDGALENDPGEPDLHVERGIALFELCRYGEAREALERAISIDPEGDGTAHYYLGLLDEREGREGAAAHFGDAARIDPERYFLPVPIPDEEFDSLVQHAVDRLPEDFRTAWRNLSITVEDLPRETDLNVPGGPPLSPQILGLYCGHPLSERSSFDPYSEFPSQIYLYRRNILRSAPDREGIVEEVRITLLHEIGHYLGLDEDDLEARGLV